MNSIQQPIQDRLHLQPYCISRGTLYSTLWMKMIKGFPLHCSTWPPLPCALSHTSLTLEDPTHFPSPTSSFQQMFFAACIQIVCHLFLEVFLG